MKLLVIGDVAPATGFGRVTRELTRRWIAAGVDVRILGINWWGRAGEVQNLLDQGTSEEIKARLDEIDADPLTSRIIPAASVDRQDGMGWRLTAPAILGMIHGPGWDGWVPEQVFIVADPAAMMLRINNADGSLERIPAWNYVPIEGEGQSPASRQTWSHVQPVAMSDFGGRVLTKLLSRPVPVIPHGISEAFYPISPSRPGSFRGQTVQSKDVAKEKFGLAGRTVILRVDRFNDRKNYPALLRSLGPVLQRHPEAIVVINHSFNDDGLGGGSAGYMVEHLSKMPGAFQVDGRWTHPQVKLLGAHDTFRGLAEPDLNVLYNAADIYASPTMCEGFGLCLAEAASTACPVVTTDYAAGPEVVGDGGLLAKVATTFTSRYANEWAIVDEDDFAQKVEYLIEHPAKRRAIGEAGARHVQRFSWDEAAARFLALFESAMPQEMEKAA